MIPQLINRVAGSMTSPTPARDAALYVLSADPFDLALHLEQVWAAANVWGAPSIPPPAPASSARVRLWETGAFFDFGPLENPAWEHLGYSYALENTRAVQILRRVVREYRSGEGLGIPSFDSQRWLNATESLLFGAPNPIVPWLSTSTVRQDPEATRRNAYWRFFGLDLAFGGDDNRPPVYDKATVANTSFVGLFEELLFELWQAISNVRNTSGANVADDDRIFRLADALNDILRARRLQQVLTREELAAATALGWVEMTLSFDTPIVADLRSQATTPADRLRLIGERVGLPAHSKSSALFSMAADLSLFLRTIENGVVTTPSLAWVLYLETPPPQPPGAPQQPVPIGAHSRRVITEWAAATGKDLKARGKPVEVNRRQLVSVK